MGQLEMLPALELACVLSFRLWCERGKTALRREAALTLGPDCARGWLDAFDEFLGLLARFSRRPLMHHGLGCRCLGADESAVATLVGAAAEGEREEAMLIGMLLVRPDMAAPLAALAETVGLGLKRLVAAGARPSASPRPAHPIRH